MAATRLTLIFALPLNALVFNKVFQLKVDLVAQLVEHNTFNVGALGSSPSGITTKVSIPLNPFQNQYLKGIFVLNTPHYPSLVVGFWFNKASTNREISPKSGNMKTSIHFLCKQSPKRILTPIVQMQAGLVYSIFLFFVYFHSVFHEAIFA